MSGSSQRDPSLGLDDRRLWIGNLDSRITEFQLLKIAQKCGAIEKFDMIFHKVGPQAGQPRGYGFVTYRDSNSARKALEKLNGKLIGTKHVVVRMAKNVNYNELEKPKSQLDIPVLAAGASSSTKISKEFTIRAIEAKLKSLEQKTDDFEINKTAEHEPPPIQKYQYNKNNSERGGHGSQTNKYAGKRKYTSDPYNKHQRRNRR